MKLNELFENDDYQGQHTAPSKDDSPLYDTSDTYGDDMYGHQALRMYRAGEPYDGESISIIQNAKDSPNKPVKIFRAVPYTPSSDELIDKLEGEKEYILKNGKVPPKVYTKLDKSEYYGKLIDDIEHLEQNPTQGSGKLKINNGDWVTINRKYASDHGKSNLGNNFKIVSKTVKAKQLFTDGNSIHEWGYWG